jgi:hypothetical protein
MGELGSFICESTGFPTITLWSRGWLGRYQIDIYKQWIFDKKNIFPLIVIVYMWVLIEVIDKNMLRSLSRASWPEQNIIFSLNVKRMFSIFLRSPTTRLHSSSLQKITVLSPRITMRWCYVLRKSPPSATHVPESCFKFIFL